VTQLAISFKGLTVVVVGAVPALGILAVVHMEAVDTGSDYTADMDMVADHMLVVGMLVEDNRTAEQVDGTELPHSPQDTSSEEERPVTVLVELVNSLIVGNWELFETVCNVIHELIVQHKKTLLKSPSKFYRLTICSEQEESLS